MGIINQDDLWVDVIDNCQTTFDVSRKEAIDMISVDDFDEIVEHMYEAQTEIMHEIFMKIQRVRETV